MPNNYLTGKLYFGKNGFFYQKIASRSYSIDILGTYETVIGVNLNSKNVQDKKTDKIFKLTEEVSFRQKNY